MTRPPTGIGIDIGTAPSAFESGPGSDSEPRRLPASAAQERLWFLQQYHPETKAYHLGVAFRLLGDLDAPRLARAFAALVQRHPALRTTFEFRDGALFQCVAPHGTLDWAAAVFPDANSDSADGRTGPALDDWLRAEVVRPFDLSRGPLIRVRLLRLAAHDHRLLLAWHHVVADGSSIRTLCREAGELYRAELFGESARVPDLTASYASHLDAIRAAPETGIGTESAPGAAESPGLRFWREHLAGAVSDLELPTDAPRSVPHSFAGGTAFLDLGAALRGDLERLARAERTTLFTVLFTAFNALLHAHSGQPDLTVGCPVAGRFRPEWEPLVGLFVNTLALRTRVDGNPTFRELLRQVRLRVFAAFDHQDIPFEQVVQALGLERQPQRQPLFQAMFAFQNLGSLRLALPGVTESWTGVDPGETPFGCTLFVHPSEPGLPVRLDHQTRWFDSAEAATFLRRFEGLLTGVARSPDTRLAELPLLTTEDTRRLADASPGPGCPRPWSTVVEAFERQAAATPTATAIESPGEPPIAFATLNARANRLAHHLRHLGTGPDRRVALPLAGTPSALVALLAILKSGAVVVPVDPALPERRRQTLLADAGCAWTLDDAPPVEGQPPTFPEPAAELRRIPVDEPRNHLPDTSPVAPPDPSHLVYLLYTSGSTGRPKGVAMEHAALANLVAWQIQRSGETRRPRTLQLAPLGFDVAFQEIFATWLAGGTVVLPPTNTRHEPRALDEIIRTAGIERVFLPPVLLRCLAEAAEDSTPPAPSLREIIVAGERLQITDAIRAFFERHPGATLDNQYGPTETHVVTAHRLSGPPAVWPSLPPIGTPVANATVRIVNASGLPVPPGAPGEIEIRGVPVARGYWNAVASPPEATRSDGFRQETTPDPSADPTRRYRTGDMARLRADGTLEFLGRRDAQVKIRGHRVELDEVELALAAQPGVEAAAAFLHAEAKAVTDSGERRLFAAIVPAGSSAPTEATLREALRAELPPAFVPERILSLPRLPLSPNGKIDRAALARTWPTTTPPVAGASDVPEDRPMERELKALWSRLLDRPILHRDDDFFALGGHSLLAMRLVVEIRHQLGVEIGVSVVFQHPTLARLASHLAARTAQAAPTAAIRGNGEGLPVFFIPGVPGVNYLPAAFFAGLGPQVRYCDALQFPGVDGASAPLDTVESLAACLNERLVALQPRGEFALAGYSLGGNVAFEMARQLAVAGRRPALVLLYDTMLPDSLRRRSFLAAATAVFRFVRRHGPRRGLPRLVDQARSKLRVSRTRLARELGLADHELPGFGGPAAERATDPTATARQRVFDASFRAFAAHRPGPYAGPVVLFRAAEREIAHGVFRERLPLNGWSPFLCGSVEVEEVPGDHWQILSDEGAALLGTRTAAWLAQASRHLTKSP